VNTDAIVGDIEKYLVDCEPPLKEASEEDIRVFAGILSESSTCLMVCSLFFERNTDRLEMSTTSHMSSRRTRQCRYGKSLA
jgi:hypothetical protein